MKTELSPEECFLLINEIGKILKDVPLNDAIWILNVSLYGAWQQCIDQE